MEWPTRTSQSPQQCEGQEQVQSTLGDTRVEQAPQMLSTEARVAGTGRERDSESEGEAEGKEASEASRETVECFLQRNNAIPPLWLKADCSCRWWITQDPRGEGKGQGRGCFKCKTLPSLECEREKSSGQRLHDSDVRDSSGTSTSQLCAQ